MMDYENNPNNETYEELEVFFGPISEKERAMQLTLDDTVTLDDSSSSLSKIHSCCSGLDLSSDGQSNLLPGAEDQSGHEHYFDAISKSLGKEEFLQQDSIQSEFIQAETQTIAKEITSSNLSREMLLNDSIISEKIKDSLPGNEIPDSGHNQQEYFEVCNPDCDGRATIIDQKADFSPDCSQNQPVLSVSTHELCESFGNLFNKLSPKKVNSNNETVSFRQFDSISNSSSPFIDEVILKSFDTAGKSVCTEQCDIEMEFSTSNNLNEASRGEFAACDKELSDPQISNGHNFPLNNLNLDISSDGKFQESLNISELSTSYSSNFSNTDNKFVSSFHNTLNEIEIASKDTKANLVCTSQVSTLNSDDCNVDVSSESDSLKKGTNSTAEGKNTSVLVKDDIYHPVRVVSPLPKKEISTLGKEVSPLHKQEESPLSKENLHFPKNNSLFLNKKDSPKFTINENEHYLLSSKELSAPEKDLPKKEIFSLPKDGTKSISKEDPPFSGSEVELALRLNNEGINSDGSRSESLISKTSVEDSIKTPAISSEVSKKHSSHSFNLEENAKDSKIRKSPLSPYFTSDKNSCTPLQKSQNNIFFTPLPPKKHFQQSIRTTSSTSGSSRVRPRINIVSPVARSLRDNPPPPLISTIKPKCKISPHKVQRDLEGSKKSEVTLPGSSIPFKSSLNKKEKSRTLPSHQYTAGKAFHIENKENCTKGSPLKSTVLKHKGRIPVLKTPKVIDSCDLKSSEPSPTSTNKGRQSFMEVSLHEPHTLQHTNTLKKLYF